MTKNNNKSISSVYDETTCIGKIMKGVLKVYESWRKLLARGLVPLTLTKSKGADLVDYKIYGESVQEGIPTPQAPIEVESVGDLVTDETDENYGKYKIPVNIINDVGEISTTDIYLNEPLRKIGDYADYIDFLNQKVVRKIYGKTLNSSLKWSDKYYPSILISLSDVEVADVSNLKIVLSKYATNPYINILNIYGTTLGFDKCDEYWNFENVDELKEWLDEHADMVAYYPLATPVEETIELPNIPTHKGTTILSVDTTIQPSNAEVIYMGKL